MLESIRARPATWRRPDRGRRVPALRDRAGGAARDDHQARRFPAPALEDRARDPPRATSATRRGCARRAGSSSATRPTPATTSISLRSPRSPPRATSPRRSSIRGDSGSEASRDRGAAVVRGGTVQTAKAFPEEFNLADYFLFDRLDGGPRRQGRRSSSAIARYTYAEVAERVARAPRASSRCRACAREERVLIVLHDTPAFAWAFFATLHHGAVVAMGNPDAPAADLAYLVEYTRAAVRRHHPARRRRHRARRSRRPACARSSSSPEVRDRRRRRGRHDVAARARRAHAVSLARRDRSGRVHRATRRRPAADAARRRRHLALHVGLDRQEQGRHPHAPRLRLQHRGLREAHRRLPRGRRHRQRPAPLLRLRDGHQPDVPVRRRRDDGPLRRAPHARVARRRHRAPPADHRHQRADDDGQAPRARRRAARRRASAASTSPACASTSPPARRCRPRCSTRFRERFRGDVYDGIGSAEMFHIYCSNRPGDIKPGSLGRVVEGYELRILSVRRRRPRASPSSRAARPASCG